MSHKACVVCQQLGNTHRLLPHFSSRQHYKYIHNVCLLLFDSSDWKKDIRVNKYLYYCDYIRRCHICNHKNNQQVVQCSRSDCKNRFHFDCGHSVHPNLNHDHHKARLLMLCHEHAHKDCSYNEDQLLQEHIDYRRLEEAGQVKHKKYKKHRRSDSSDRGKFSSDEEVRKKHRSPPKQYSTPTALITLPSSIVTTDMLTRVFKGDKPSVEKEKSPSPSPVMMPQKIYPTQVVETIEDPKYPNPYSDPLMLKWWESIDKVYFPEVEHLHLTQEELAANKWFERAIDDQLLEYSKQSNYEPLIQVRYLYRNSINVLFKHQQQYSLIRYQIHNIPNQQLTSSNTINSVKVFTQDLQVTIPQYEGEKIGHDLHYIEQTELTPEEYNDGLQLEQKIQAVERRLEDEADGFEFQQIAQLDIAYEILKDELNALIADNNKQRTLINNQITPKRVNNDQLMLDVLRWTQIVNSLQNGYKDKGEEVLQIFFKLPSDERHAESQKSLINIQQKLSRLNDKPLDTDCKICFGGHMTDANPVTYCDQCQTSFHKVCYGLVGRDLDEAFLCDSCEYFKIRKKNPKCGICKKLGFPQKRLQHDHFYHITCLLLVNAIKIQNGQFKFRDELNPQLLKNLLTEQLPQCSVCGLSKGYRFSCSYECCRHAFHPICAYLNGLHINVQTESLDKACREARFVSVSVVIRCVMHCNKNLDELLKQTYYRRFALNFEQTAKLGGYEQFLKEFELTKEYKYLSTMQPTVKNDSLQINQYQPPKAN